MKIITAVSDFIQGYNEGLFLLTSRFVLDYELNFFKFTHKFFRSIKEINRLTSKGIMDVTT